MPQRPPAAQALTCCIQARSLGAHGQLCGQALPDILVLRVEAAHGAVARDGGQRPSIYDFPNRHRQLPGNKPRLPGLEEPFWFQERGPVQLDTAAQTTKDPEASQGFQASPLRSGNSSGSHHPTLPSPPRSVGRHVATWESTWSCGNRHLSGDTPCSRLPPRPLHP